METITKGIERITSDPALVVSMPGCYIEGANPAADRYFKKRIDKRLSEYAEQRSKECLCKILVGANAYMAQFCPIEIANVEIARFGMVEPQLFALQYDPKSKQSTGDWRVYELFLVHSKSVSSVTQTEASFVELRLLPFPSGMTLRVKDIPGTSPGPAFERLPALPHGIQLEVPTILERTFLIAQDLAQTSVLADLQSAGRFFDEVLAGLDCGMAPSVAWRVADENHSGVSRQVPLSVASYFSGDAAKTSEEARDEIAAVWEHPLDAPVLVRTIFPEILKRIRNDRYLSYAPQDRRAYEDLERYYRLHIPIEDLEKQDRCIEWLPRGIDYRDERNELRDDLYGQPSLSAEEIFR